MGGGKTRAIVELALDAALAYPNNNVLVARQHLSERGPAHPATTARYPSAGIAESSFKWRRRHAGDN